MGRRDEGSMFIETMIAAAIVAVMLGGLYQSMSAAAVRHRMSEDRRAALMVAQSMLAAAGRETPLVQGHTAVLAGDYVAQVDVTPYPAATGESAAGQLSLVTVSVRAKDSVRPLVSLQTLRLAGAG